MDTPPPYTFSPPFGIRIGSGTLQSTVVWWTLIATALGMSIYTFVEFLIARPADWSEFLLHHIMHVALICLAVWIASIAVVKKLVIAPVNHLFIHLKKISAGRLEYLDIEAHSNEMDDVFSSINGLVAKLKSAPKTDAISDSLDHLRELRSALKNTKLSDEEDAVPIMRLVTKLEGDLLEIVRTEP